MTPNLNTPSHQHVLGSWTARAALAAVALAALLFAFGQSAPEADAQSAVRAPSVAVSAPGVLMIYTAKGGEMPGCTSEVEYRTPPGSGNADGTVNVTTANTHNKGDYYRFTSAELTSGNSYDFRVRHTAGSNAACQPQNTWSNWSRAVTFKGKVTIPNIGAVRVTPKTATDDGDTTGSALTNNQVQRGSWVALHFEPVNGTAFPHGIVLEACAKRNSSDLYATDCNNQSGIFDGERIHIERGEREVWHWFYVSPGSFLDDNTIHLRFRTMSGNHNYWQWENPDQCLNNVRFRSESPCKRLTLTATSNISNSPPDSTPPQEIVVDGVPQSEQQSALEAKIQARIDKTAGNAHSNRIWRGALAAVRGEDTPLGAREVDAAYAQRLSDSHGARGRAELSSLWQEIADALNGVPPLQQQQQDDPPPPPPEQSEQQSATTFTPNQALVDLVQQKADSHSNPGASARLQKIVNGMTGQGDGYSSSECRETANRYGVGDVWEPWCAEIERRENFTN